MDSMEDLIYSGGNTHATLQQQPIKQQPGRKIDKNKGACKYEFLQGNLVLFYANKDWTTDFQFLLQAVIACNRHLVPFTQQHMKGVTLSNKPNCDDPMSNTVCDGYKKTAIVILKNKGQTLHDLKRVMGEIIHYLNHHVYSTAGDLRQQPSYNNYSLVSEPDMTSHKQPKRKIGDVIRLKEAIEFLQQANPSVFNPNIYSSHANLITRYFNPPYPPELQEAFGFPQIHT
jgi:hypothetical protein